MNIEDGSPKVDKLEKKKKKKHRYAEYNVVENGKDGAMLIEVKKAKPKEKEKP